MATALLLGLGVVATVLAYPPAGFAPLAVAMLAPVVAAIDDRRPRDAFARVWIYSVIMALVLVRWLVHALAIEYGVPLAPAWIFTVLIVGGCALVPSGAAALYVALAPKVPLALAPLLFGALWTLGEWLRADPLGIPWLLAAQAFTRVPLVLQTADLGGTFAVSFWVAAVNAGLGLAGRRRSTRPLLAPALLAALALGYGAWRMSSPALRETTLRVGIVQAAVPQGERFQPGSALRNTQRHMELSRELAQRGPLDLLVWSETAIDTDLDQSPDLRSAVERLVTELGLPLVTGAPRSEAGARTNSAVLFAPGRGLVESYAKQRLVPFSEYDPALAAPLAVLIPAVTQGDPYQPGDEALVFSQAPLPFATPICFEITYPHLVRRFRANGAELLVNISNDVWFGRTGYLEMHFGHAVMRAVELRSWIVRSANTGISAVIDPAGRVRAELPAFEEGALVAEVGRAATPSLYARAGDGPILALLSAVVVLCAASGRRSPRPRPGPGGTRPWRPDGRS